MISIICYSYPHLLYHWKHPLSLPLSGLSLSVSLSFHLPMFITLSIFFILYLLSLFPFAYVYNSLYLFHSFFLSFNLPMFISLSLRPSLSLYSLSLSFFHFPMFISLSLFILSHNLPFSIPLSFPFVYVYISLFQSISFSSFSFFLFFLPYYLSFSIPLSFPFVYVYVSLFKSFYALVRDSTFNCLSLAPVCTYLGMFQYSFYRYQVLYVIVVFLSVSISVLSICLYAFI